MWIRRGTPLVLMSAAEFVHGGGVFYSSAANLLDGESPGPCSHLDDHASAGPGEKFTGSRKKKILEENRRNNGGKLKDDVTGEELVQPAQGKRGVKPDQMEAHVDHNKPKSRGGSNSEKHARVRARKPNLKKSDKMPDEQWLALL